jgi:general secretion pathway protein D
MFEKLESIIIPELNFTDVDVADAVRFLNEQSKALDPERKGINFVLKANPTTSAASAGNEAPPPIQRSITLNLRQVPLLEVLNFIKNLTNLQYKVEEYAVFIFPSTETSDVLVIRSFSVPPSFFTVTPRPTGEVGATGGETVQFVTADVKQELEQKGVKFPAGASAAYLPRSAKLIVRNTLDQINLIAQLLADQSDASTQIEIETKFIEFNQDKLKDFSFNYRLDSKGNVPLTDAILIGNNYLSNVGNLADDARPARVETNLRTANDLPNSDIDALLGLGGNRGANTLSFGAILGGNGASMLISALESAVGADLMSAPKVTVVNGQQAKIRVVRELIYPTEYEAPEIVNSAEDDDGVASFTAVPSTPGGFETRDVGVILDVKADATQDRRISLELTPEVTEFQGFINYGGDVREASATPGGQLRVQGVALTPVFSLRKVTTKLNVVDGQTVVMGGFIREDSQKIQDKIPLLGDIPLVGRLFRSESERSIKRNLVIFTTARIINPDGKPKFLTASELDAMETLEVRP